MLGVIFEEYTVCRYNDFGYSDSEIEGRIQRGFDTLLIMLYLLLLLLW